MPKLTGPYPGVPKEKIPMMDSCVLDVMKKDKTMSKSDAIAVCHKQIMGSAAPQTYKGNFKSVVDLSLIAAENGGELPTEIQVLPIGEFMTQPYGPMVFDDNVFNQMVGNFDRQVRKAVPVDVDHDGGKAAGWINKLVNKVGQGLFAVVDWTKYGEELLTDKLYKLFSPEWSFDYVDPEHSTHFGAVLVAGSLTNRPLFKDLPLLVASDGTVSNERHLTNANQIMILLDSKQKAANDTMNKKDILAKKPADRTAEEVEFLKTAELDEAEKSQVENETKEAEAAAKAEAEAKAKADADAEAAKAEADAKAKADADAAAAAGTGAGGANNEANDKPVTIKASELAHYKELEAANIKAQEELRKVATEKEIQAFVANDKGGKILPKSKDAVVDFVMKCSDDQKKAFLAILSGLPEIKVAGELGEGGNSALTAQEKINNLVAEKIKAAKEAHEKLSKAEAIRQVLSENTELSKQYDAESKKS